MKDGRLDPDDSLALETLSPISQSRVKKIETVDELMGWLADKLKENDSVNKKQHRDIVEIRRIIVGHTRADGEKILGVSERIRDINERLTKIEEIEKKRKWIWSMILMAAPVVAFVGNILVKLVLKKFGINM